MKTNANVTFGRWLSDGRRRKQHASLRTATGLDRPTQARLCRYVAVRPIAKSTDAHDTACGLCGERLIYFRFRVKGRRVEIFSCSTCGWHTRRVDGTLVTQPDLLDLASSGSMTDRGADALSWYRGGVYSRRMTRP